MWTDKLTVIACNLWASMWSQCLIGQALGFSGDQVEAKFGRMRIQKDTRIEHADLVRCISKVGGARVICIADMQPFLTNEEFRAGLFRALRKSGARGAPKPKEKTMYSDDETDFTAEEVQQDMVLAYFSYGHLPQHLQDKSRPFARLARTIIDTTPRNAQRTIALNKLLEAKDAAVRAALPLPQPVPRADLNPPTAAA